MVEVWQEHWQAVDLFCQLGTQWRVGFGGTVGLDYIALNMLLDLHHIKQDKRLELFKKIQILENTALQLMHEKDA